MVIENNRIMGAGCGYVIFEVGPSTVYITGNHVRGIPQPDPAEGKSRNISPEIAVELKKQR